MQVTPRMRGVGEGSRDWDLGAGSSMTHRWQPGRGQRTYHYDHLEGRREARRGAGRRQVRADRQCRVIHLQATPRFARVHPLAVRITQP